MADLHRFGLLARLTRELLDRRERADGQGRPPDWVTGPAAALIVERVDATLALLGQR